MRKIDKLEDNELDEFEIQLAKEKLMRLGLPLTVEHIQKHLPKKNKYGIDYSKQVVFKNKKELRAFMKGYREVISNESSTR